MRIGQGFDVHALVPGRKLKFKPSKRDFLIKMKRDETVGVTKAA